MKHAARCMRLIFLGLVIGVTSAYSPWFSLTKDVGLVRIGGMETEIDGPMFLTHAGDKSGRLFIAEQAGRIFVVKDWQVAPEPFIDLRDRVFVAGQVMGLLSVAFHPDFPANRRFFVSYTAGPTKIQLRTFVVEFRASGRNRAVADRKGRVILEITQPFADNNGGQLAFGPDGYLYIGMGDGGGTKDLRKHGQNTETLLGAILRIDVDKGEPYGIPPDNPFVNRPGRDEVWAYGFHNPTGLAFDKRRGALYVVDVGQNGYQEINHVVRGGNYGWSIMEGQSCVSFRTAAECATEGLELPIHTIDRVEGRRLVGGVFYRGRTLDQKLKGTYVFGDRRTGDVWGLRPFGPTWTRIRIEKFQPVRSIAEDEHGELYVLLANGRLLLLQGNDGSVWRGPGKLPDIRISVP